MNQDNVANYAAELARRMNLKLHAEQLNIPIVSGFQIVNDNNPQTIVMASKGAYTEQLTSDGYIADGDFEKRINLVIENTKKFMKANNCENIDDSFIYYKDYSNGTFNYKLYFEDIIIPVQVERKIIRMIIAYFVEPRMHDFYQMSLSVGPFGMPTEILKPGVIDIENDKVTWALDKIMKDILDNLKYKS